LENRVFGGWVNPAAIALADRLFPGTLLRDLLVGPYGLLTMALTYALALILPIVTTFFVAFGVLEDSGYLPRLAVMVNRVFRKMGLNGKAVLPMVLGLGCDTMATLTTRVLETPKERLIVILLLALGVPCSAQLAVVMTLLSGLSPLAALVWAAVVAGVIVVVGRLAAAVLPGRGSDFILELPPLRVPRPGNLLAKTLARVEWYLREAVPLFVLGTLILFVADRLRLLGVLERLAEPVVTGALGLPPETAGAFLIGFLRRDFGAAGLYRLAREGRLQPGQVLVAAVTITLFIPCIANFFMIVKERGWRTALAIAAFIIPFTVGVGAALNALLRALPVAPW
jgi:ferrous iron transport protein B